MKKKIEGDKDMPQKTKEMYKMETEMMIKELKAEIEGDSFEHFFQGVQDKFKDEFRKTRGKNGRKKPTEDETDDAMEEINSWFGDMKDKLKEKYDIDSKEMVKQVKNLRNKKWGSKESRGQEKRRGRGSHGKDGKKSGGKGILGKMESLLDTDDMKTAFGEGPDKPEHHKNPVVWVCGIAVFAGLMWYVIKVFKKHNRSGPGGNNVVQGEVVNYDNISFE